MSALPFQLDRAHLVDFRCFAGFTLDLEPDCTLLVAPNGGGKSAVLDALAAGAGAALAGTSGPGLQDTDRRNVNGGPAGKAHVLVNLQIQHTEQTVELARYAGFTEIPRARRTPPSPSWGAPP